MRPQTKTKTKTNRGLHSAAVITGLAAAMLLPACGGSSFSGDGSGLGGTGQGGGGTAGTAQGGTAQGGSAQGGSAQGGSAQGGSAQGGSAQGGSAGAAMGGAAGAGLGGAAGSGAGGSPAGGAAGTMNAGGSAGTAMGGAAGSAGSAGSSACGEECELQGFTCCGDECVNLGNDRNHCGMCDRECENPAELCYAGDCAPPPCRDIVCVGTATCCGTECCEIGTQCCAVPGPVGESYTCVEAGETCPRGCVLCVCAAPDTMVSTPEGERSIAELAIGDLVYSVDRGRIVVAPLVAVRKVPVHNHRVVRLTLASGAVIEMSPLHPTADGRAFKDLKVDEQLDGMSLVRVELVDYEADHTYDILPATSTGSYFAQGALVGSTLATAPERLSAPSSQLAPMSGYQP